MNVCPGSDVMRTLIQSEMTGVPPVTADGRLPTRESPAPIRR